MSLIITDVAEIPRVERPKAPNPFAEKVAELASRVDEGGRSQHAARVQLPAEGSGPLIRQLHAAGRAVGVSVRKSVEKDGENLLITFWTIAKVTRKRQDETETAKVIKT